MNTLPTIDMPGQRAYPPRVSAFTRPFWQALGEGRWISTRCDGCGHQTFPPKLACPRCGSTAVAWTPLDTRGTLYSWTRVHAAPTAFAAEAPYCLGIVDLDAGVRLACRLIDDARAPPRIGGAVEMLRLRYADGDLFAARMSGACWAPLMTGPSNTRSQA
jgi:uncharacterized OB-fold protein